MAAQASVDLWALAVSARMSQRGRRDVERELLRDLLRQDDAFFQRRAPAEIMSRLGGDLQRIGARRQMVTQAIATLLSVAAEVGSSPPSLSTHEAAAAVGRLVDGISAPLDLDTLNPQLP